MLIQFFYFYSGHYASLNRDIYIVVDPVLVDVDNSAIALGTHNFYTANHDDPPT